MLTKDLLSYSLKSTRIIPHFIDVDAPPLLQFAEQLLAIFDADSGKTREAIETEAELYLQGQADLKFAKGLYKILLDHANFTLAEDNAGPRRSAILTAAAAQLKGTAPQTLQQYRDAVAAQSQQVIDTPLYPDLPAFEQLTRIKSFTPRQLLQRYNMAQVQALLLSTQSLTLTTNDMSAANLRRIFKCLKFFRLLAEIKQSKDKTTVVIDGPLSLLEGSRKYGLQIASFFPIICLLEQWQISAKVQPKRAVKTLKLDESAQLISHYRHMSAYVPEEVKLFAKHFADTVEDWHFVAESPFLKRPKGRLIFPDFTLQHRSGVIVYLEIFHRWHRGPLTQRLEELEKMKEPLILAIDRFLLKGDWQDSIDSLDNNRHFLFSEYPTVSRLKKTLDGYLARESDQSVGF
ncbi:DUF790 family protein [Ferrimonas pelagia]|uniref:DUF790 family protein n=1 Tax=Ferrimonas pelagia TaxID=1177826 RepID=A0ABP9F3X4_9GAMM